MLLKLRPVIWLFAIALGVAAVASNGCLDFQVVHIRGRASSGAAYLVINSREDLVAYVNLKSTMLPPPSVGGTSAPPNPRVEPPDIDFSKYTRLVFSRGPSTGHSIFFGDIREFNSEIRVRVFDMSPGPGCTVTQEISYPRAEALIPHTLKVIRFEQSQASTDCSVYEVVGSPSVHPD
jgi:hypothetical protein